MSSGKAGTSSRRRRISAFRNSPAVIDRWFVDKTPVLCNDHATTVASIAHHFGSILRDYFFPSSHYIITCVVLKNT